MLPEHSADATDPDVAPGPVADLHYPTLPARPRSLSMVRHALARWAARTGLIASQIDDLVLSVDEAVTNVVEHAYADQRGDMALLAVFRLEPARVEVSVTDHGRWGTAAPRSHGRGLLLIDELADRSVIQRRSQGTTVDMMWLIRSR
jgi:anti-sigma regulatory factor (Ser/Thr protein kinase)